VSALERPRRRPTLSDLAASSLEDKILRGELREGTRLPSEAELMDVLGVGRSVVRDAIRTLAARGLVSVRQGTGMVVTQPSDTAYARALFLLLMRSDLSVSDVVAARRVLETELVPIAAEHATAADLEHLDQNLDRLQAAIEQLDWPAARDAHLAFHLGLLEAVHLPALTILLKPMQEITLLSWERPLDAMTRESWELYTSAHRPIVDALREKSPVSARRAIEAHFAAFAAEPFPKLEAERFRDSPAVIALMEQMTKAR
jgi:GntR family transcriptional repressor for pyruvate dehydrogenase complex